jgi:hypothetical protein
MPEHPPLDDDISGLYRGPPAEFVAARQALAKRLRQAGDPRQAEVRELAKPPVSAWAVNRLFALEPRAMAELVGAGERARTDQGRARGNAGAAALRELVAAIRSGIERLTGRGVEILAAETGRAPGEAIVERLRTDLQALAFDPATTPAAARGWLDADLEPPGFELLAALTVATSPARPGPRPSPAPPAAAPAPAGKGRRATVHSLDEARGAAAERRERERRERIERAQADLARAETAAAATRRAAEAARRDAERADRDAERAESAAAEAARRAETARAAAQTARSTAGEAEARAEAAGKDHARARDALARAKE